jgi:outer membrane lipoprotein-sorting protein
MRTPLLLALAIGVIMASCDSTGSKEESPEAVIADTLAQADDSFMDSAAEEASAVQESSVEESSSASTVGSSSDAKSREILKRVSKDYQTYKTIFSKFTLITKASNGRESKSRGQIWMKGKKFKLDYGEQEIYCNENFVWTYVKGDIEVSKDSFKYKSTSISPSDLFTIYDRDFKSMHEGEVSRLGHTYDVIHMVPNRAKSYSWSWVRIEVDQANNKVQRLIQHNKNGTEVIIEVDLKTFATNQTLADSYFEWNSAAHEDVEVIDLTR